MEIKKGIVRDQGYDDVNCTYGITEDGKQYYFIEKGELEDNKVIASTVLKEAIKHAKDTSLGVIDLDGNIIIPFENRVIKIIDNKYLLVERTAPKDENVQKSLASRNDPLSATKLVTTAAGLKEKMHNEMGTDGKFVFNDQFSEAAIYDFDGNNLTNDGYYSYIGIEKDKIYCCKNTLDSEVKAFSMNKDIKDSVLQEENELETSEEGNLNVLSESINNNEIATAINEEMKKQEENIKTEEKLGDEEIVKTEENPENEENKIVDEKNDLPEDNNFPTKNIFSDVKLPTVAPDEVNKEEENDLEKTIIPGTEVVKEETKTIDEEKMLEEKVSAEDKEATDESNGGIIAENVTKEQTTMAKDIFENEFKEETNIPEEKAEQEDTKSTENSKIVSTEQQETIPMPTAKIPDKIEFPKEENVSKKQESTIESNSINNEAIENDSFEAEKEIATTDEFIVKDAIIEEVRDTMKDLINQNKEQQETIDSQEKQLSDLETENQNLKNQNNDQGRKISLLETRIRNYEAMISKLEAKNQMLDTKNHMQEKTIVKQEDELNILRPQVEGKKDLVALLADAKTILKDTDTIDYDFDSFIKSKAA